jgi:hypothetical protein
VDHDGIAWDNMGVNGKNLPLQKKSKGIMGQRANLSAPPPCHGNDYGKPFRKKRVF